MQKHPSPKVAVPAALALVLALAAGAYAFQKFGRRVADTAATFQDPTPASASKNPTGDASENVGNAAGYEGWNAITIDVLGLSFKYPGERFDFRQGTGPGITGSQVSFSVARDAVDERFPFLAGHAPSSDFTSGIDGAASQTARLDYRDGMCETDDFIFPCDELETPSGSAYYGKTEWYLKPIRVAFLRTVDPVHPVFGMESFADTDLSDDEFKRIVASLSVSTSDAATGVNSFSGGFQGAAVTFDYPTGWVVKANEAGLSLSIPGTPFYIEASEVSPMQLLVTDAQGKSASDHAREMVSRNPAFNKPLPDVEMAGTSAARVSNYVGDTYMIVNGGKLITVSVARISADEQLGKVDALAEMLIATLAVD